MEEEKICWYCGGVIKKSDDIKIDNDYWHFSCAKKAEMIKKQNPEEEDNNAPLIKKWERFTIDILGLLAWLNLIGGIISAFALLEDYGICITLLLIFEGVVGWALLLVIANAADNLVEIRNNTLK